ncbi:MAG: hypothetical protein ACJ8J0_06285 [Longimicrobiaceae bacterium]
MALREFRDSRGTAWMAWDVPPAREYAQVRSGVDRRQTHTAGYHPERRVLRDRRRRLSGPGLERGWVCFQSDAEKRRLAPPPGNWQEAADDALEALLGQAEPIAARRRMN